jgi:microcystin-dependent protein
MQWPKLKWVSLLAVMAIFLTWSAVLAGTVPNTLNYQGTLYDSNGQPINASENITVSLYNVASGGSAFWTEIQNGINVKNGNFALVLGAVSNNLLDQTRFTGTTYIGIKLGTDVEMSPRQQFTSVAYAFKSGDVPQGVIVMWSGAINQIPAGWAICDGNNGTPDLRDRFVVGAGGGYVPRQTGGEATHTLIEAEMPSHKHLDAGHDHQYFFEDRGNGNSGANGSTRRGSYSDSTSTGYANIQPTGGGLPHNNLPPYYALALIMKL